DDAVVRTAVPVVRDGVRAVAGATAVDAQEPRDAGRRGRGTLACFRHGGGDQQGAHDAERALLVFVPLGGEVGIAGAATGAQRDRGDAEGDRHVRVGGGARELVIVTHRARRRNGGLDER